MSSNFCARSSGFRQDAVEAAEFSGVLEESAAGRYGGRLLTTRAAMNGGLACASSRIDVSSKDVS